MATMQTTETPAPKIFSANHLERYSQVLLWGLQKSRHRKLKPGQAILIQAHHAAQPLVEALYRQILKLGLNPICRTALTPQMEQDFYQLANDLQLTFIPPGTKTLYKNISGRIYLHAPKALTHLKDIATDKITQTALAHKPLKTILAQRESAGELGWTLGVYPTRAMAEKASLTLEDYGRLIQKACFLNRVAPLDHWGHVDRQITNIKKWLNKMKIRTLHIESRKVDLEVQIGEKRQWLGLSGRNIPSFEIFTSPDWRGTRGYFFADSSSFKSGVLVEGVKLQFEKGRVIQSDAEKGARFLKAQLSIDTGAKQLGEFSLTDRRFSKIDHFMANTLFDENYGGRHGNCHVAVGSSYIQAFSGNRRQIKSAQKRALGFNQSAIHWDMVNTERKIVTAHLAGGKSKVIYENGEFTL